MDPWIHIFYYEPQSGTNAKKQTKWFFQMIQRPQKLAVDLKMKLNESQMKLEQMQLLLELLLLLLLLLQPFLPLFLQWFKQLQQQKQQQQELQQQQEHLC